MLGQVSGLVQLWCRRMADSGPTRAIADHPRSIPSDRPLEIDAWVRESAKVRCELPVGLRVRSPVWFLVLLCRYFL